MSLAELALQLFVAAAEVALRLLPHDALRSALDDAARRRVDATIDVAEAALTAQEAITQVEPK